MLLRRALLVLSLLVVAQPAGTAAAVPGPEGALTHPVGACLSTESSLFGAVAQDPECADAWGLDGASGVALSPDGLSAYVAASTLDSVAAFRLDPVLGSVQQLGDNLSECVSNDSDGGGATTPTDQRCGPGQGLDGAREVTVSPDGKHVYVAAASSGAVAAFTRNLTTGALTQLADPTGCVSNDTNGGAADTPLDPQCAAGQGLAGANAVATSPGGEHVYATASSSQALAAFSRDATSGALTQLAGGAACLADATSGDPECTVVEALRGPVDVAVSPDGKNVYVAALTSDAVAVFSRNSSTGALTQLAGTAGCVANDTTAEPACAQGEGLDGAASVAVTADGAFVYVGTSDGDSVAAFSRDPSTGALTQLAGAAACVANDTDGGPADTPADPACTPVQGLDSPRGVALAGDASLVVAAGASDAVAFFARDTTTGALTQLAGSAACISNDTDGGPADTPQEPQCAPAQALDGAIGIVATADGRSAYVAAVGSDSLVVLARAGASGPFTQPSSTDECVRQRASSTARTGCFPADQVGSPIDVEISADGKHLYAVSLSESFVARFVRDTSTGFLTQENDSSACISNEIVANTPQRAGCQRVPGLEGLLDLALSPDGRTAYAVGQQDDAVAILSRDLTSGTLGRLAGNATCVSDDTNGGVADTPRDPACRAGQGLDEPAAVAVSPDGEHVYVGGVATIAVLDRDTTTGELTQLAGAAGCVARDIVAGPTATPLDPQCTAAQALAGVAAIALSPDGRSLYAASASGDSVAVFSRDAATGALAQLAGTAACIANDTNGGPADTPADPECRAGQGLDLPSGVTVSPDGLHVYVTSENSEAVAVFTRDPATGALTQLAGAGACVANDTDGGPADTPSDPECAAGHALDTSHGVRTSPDGRTVYVASRGSGGSTGGVAVFARDAATGALTQLAGTAGCRSNDGTFGASVTPGDPQCALGLGLGDVGAVALDPLGRFVYAVGSTTQSVSILERQAAPTCGAASATTTAGTPVSIALSCTDANGDAVTLATATGPAHGALGPIDQGGRTVAYTPAADFAGTDTFTYVGSDAVGAGGAATVTVTVAAGPAAPPAPPAAPPTPPAAPASPPAAADSIAPTLAVKLGALRLSAKGTVTVTVTCTDPSSPCTGTVAIASRKKVDPTRILAKASILALGSARFTAASGKRTTVTVKVPAKGRRVVAALGSLGVTVTTRATDAAGNRTTRALRGTLKPPRR